MVILGGLEVLAAGYLIHKHNKNKKERARLEEQAAELEESSYSLFPPDHRPSRRHSPSVSASASSHSLSHSHNRYDGKRDAKRYDGRHEGYSESDEERRERRERRRRRKEKEQKEEEKLRRARTNSAPPSMNMSTQSLVAPGVVAGWPAHWDQSKDGLPPPPGRPQQSTPQPQQTYHQGPPQVGPVGEHGFPQDIKYGFVPEIPHDEYPPYPPPPFEEAVAESSREERRRKRREDRLREEALREDRDRRDRREREGDRLGVRGRRERRSLSPMLGIYDEDSRSPGRRVRFSTEDVVLGGSNHAPKHRS